MLNSQAKGLLNQEARGLIARLNKVRPFALHMPMVQAATVAPHAFASIENLIARGKKRVRTYTDAFMRELNRGRWETPAEAQKKFSIIKMRFNELLSQFDIFSEVLTQRSEHDIGVWLSGLDAVASDALRLRDFHYEIPPVVCYLDRGIGASIRRAGTWLPGGSISPVAIIKVPRERMVGSSIASSLVHECGHQASVLLGLIESMKAELSIRKKSGSETVNPWKYYDLWISEILADFWAVAKVGITSTLGLIAVVSLPRPYVFRINHKDPHPFPWIRVKISAAIGNALYTHPQWEALSRLWEDFYPKDGLDAKRLNIINSLEASVDEFASLLVNHRPNSLEGHTLKEVMNVDERSPAKLAALRKIWNGDFKKMFNSSPCLVFAVLGQARAEGVVEPEDESDVLSKLLTNWALKTSANTAKVCLV